MKSALDSGVYDLAPLPSSAEFEDRVRRLQIQMEEAGLDAVVLTSQENFEYFSSYRSMAWTYHARPDFLVVGRSGTIIVGVEALTKRALAAAGAKDEAQFYRGFLPEAAEAVVSACRSLAGTSAKIGVDYGHELYGRGSLALIDGLRKLGTVVEVGDVLWKVRAIKSEFELEMMRATFDIMNRAFDDVIKTTRAGTSEVDMYKALQIELVRNGADRVPPFSVLSGRNGFLYSRPSTNRRFEEGDYVWTDFRSYYGGYPADRNRIARVGEPSASERETYATVRQVTKDLCEGIQAGSTCADAYQLFRRLWKESGLKDVADFGRIGHGGGIAITEPPSIAPDSSEPIEVGMVLHLEPKLELDHGVFQFEEVVYIGENGNEFLSDLGPAELPVIQL